MVTTCLPYGGRTISGPAHVCVGQSGVGYSIQKIKNASSYTWNVPPGATIVSGANTNVITVNFSYAAVSGNITLYATNSCGNGETMTFPVTVHGLPHPVIAGDPTACIGVQETYSTTGGMNSYTWSFAPVAVIVSGGGASDSTVAVRWTNAGATWVRVNYTNGYGCTDTLATQYHVQVYALPQPALAGDTTACAGTTGHVYFTETGMSQYTWIIPSGGTVISGGSLVDDSVTIGWTTAGTKTLSVNYTDAAGCTAVTAATRLVTVAPLPANAGLISGQASVYPGQAGITYNTEIIPGATGYAWTLPTGATLGGGSGTNAVTLDFNPGFTGGYLSVAGTNGCGNGGVSPPFFISAFLVPYSLTLNDTVIGNGDTLCFNAMHAIYLAGPEGDFTVQSGGSATLVSGQQILFYSGSRVHAGGYLRGFISTTGKYCGSYKDAIPEVFAEGKPTAEQGPLTGTQGLFRCYPNPTKGGFFVEFNARPKEIPQLISIYNMMGELVVKKKMGSPGISNEISLDGMPAGLYVVRAGHGMMKIVKH